MTLYGEEVGQFRPHPTAVALGVTTLFLALLATLATSFVLSAVDSLLLMNSASESMWPVYAPLASAPQSLASSVESDGTLHHYSLPAQAGVSFGLAWLAAFFWPGKQKFSNRLLALSFSVALATFGILAPGLHSRRVLTLAEHAHIPAWLTTGALIVLALITIVAVERRTVAMLTNFYVLGFPTQRLRLWLLRIPAPFGILAAACWWNGYRAGAYAALIAILVTLIENLSRIPKDRFEELSHPELREAAATLPLVGTGLIAASILFFGWPGLNRYPEAVVLSPTEGVEMQHIAYLERKILQLPPLKDPSVAKPAEPPPKIRMRWSKDRKK